MRSIPIVLITSRQAAVSLVLCAILALLSTVHAGGLPRFDETPAAERVPGQRYVDEGGQTIYWPKVQVTSQEVYSGELRKYPNYRREYTEGDFERADFAADRLGTLPPVGQHPRLYVTPDDVQRIRDQVAMGDAAPYYFRVVWAVFKEQAGVDAEGNIPTDKIARVTGTGYSMVTPFLRQIIYAQIMNDEALGRTLAQRLAVQAEEDLKVLAHYDTQSFRDNFWVVSDTRWMPDGHPMKARGQWYWPMYPEAYDYCWRWLDEAGRASVRKVMATIIKDRFSHFMEIPSNHHLINHASMAMLFGSYFLAIEGEEGFDAQQYAQVREKFDEVLEYYISPDGIMYENVKGFLPWQIYLAMARREEGKPLRHPHLFEHMRQTIFSARNLQNTYVSWTRPPIRANPETNDFARAFWDPRGGEESRSWQVQGSGHPIMFMTMMHYFYPERKDFDLIYKAAMHTANYNFFPNKELRTWLREVEFPMLMLAFASDGVVDAEGKPVDWNHKPVDFMKETAHIDMERGLGQMRTSWQPDALQLDIACRNDFYTGGHETPDLGNFNFAAHGVYWAPYFGAYQEAMHRNVITVDGKNGSMPSVSGNFVSQQDSPAATTAVMEYSRGMQFSQHDRNELILHPKLSLPFHQWMAGNYGWGRSREQQAAFAPATRWFHEYQSSVDFGQWDCQSTFGSFYKPLLPAVQYAWRTVQMVKGETPFLLILDDVKLDDQLHDFRFNLNLNPDIVLLSQPMADELLFGRSDLAKERGAVGRPLKWKVPQGEPLLFVKVLNRQTESEYPHPAYEMMDGKAMLAIPARTTSPSFKTLIYPHRAGAPKPAVSWSEDKSRLTIKIGSATYSYLFGKADNGRTVYVMAKNGDTIETVTGRPPRPQFLDVPPAHPASRYAKEGPDLGPAPQKVDPAPVPTRVFIDEAILSFASTGPGQEIRYTLDGSVPTPDSALYVGPVPITETAHVKATTYSRLWPFGDTPFSAPAEARFERQAPAVGLTASADALAPGLVCEVFEIFRPEWDTDGFVNPTIDLLPQLDNYTPILTTVAAGFELPVVRGQQAIEEVYKGYYRFDGVIEIEASGVYTFDVLSNGPLRLTVGTTPVIEETGYYHLNNAHRHGEIALAAGRHAVSLTVCDPVFYQKERDGDMPFSVTMSRAGATLPMTLLASAGALAKHAENPYRKQEIDVVALQAQTPPTALTRGLLRETYGQTELVPATSAWMFTTKAAPAGLFDLDDRPVLETVWADDVIAGSDFSGQVYVYRGWYRAPYTGLYQFYLDTDGNNQLQLNGETIVQNGVPGSKVDGRVHLHKGYHQLTVKFGASGGLVTVQSPVDTEPQRLSFADLFREKAIAEVRAPENFLVLGLAEDGYRVEEQEVRTPAGNFRLRVEGAQVVNDEAMGEVVEFSGEGSGLRLYDWPAVGRYLTLSFWVRLPENSPRKEFVQIGREGATGDLESNGVNLGFPRFNTTKNRTRIKELAAGEWVYLTLQWGPTTRIYVNGKLQSETYAAGDPTMVSRPHNHNARSEQMQLFVGRDGSFKGKIADLKVYGALLKPEEVESLYSTTRKPIPAKQADH